LRRITIPSDGQIYSSNVAAAHELLPQTGQKGQVLSVNSENLPGSAINRTLRHAGPLL
jgi:hypothetical protein